MIKVTFPIKYNGGSIYERKDGWGYRAVVHYGGDQYSKTSRQIEKLKVWIDRNSGIVREGKTPLTNTENVQYRQAVALLPPGVSLMEAVKDYCRFKDAQENGGRGRTFAGGVSLFLSECKVRGVKKPTYVNYERYLGRVGRAWGGESVSSITTEMVRKLMSLEESKAPTTRHLYHNLLTIFFNFLVKQGWIAKNPVSPVARPKIPPRRPGLFAPEEVQAVMDAAVRMVPDLVPFFALCFFAGIRPETVQRLGWEHIEKEKVFIPMELNKTPIDYEVPIRPNLAAWLSLTPSEHRKGPICIAAALTQKLIGKVRMKSGVKWIQDGPRHTFASCVCALEGTEKAVEQMGHRSPTMLYRHYRKLIGKEQAQAFFEVFPKGFHKNQEVVCPEVGQDRILANSLPGNWAI